MRAGRWDQRTDRLRHADPAPDRRFSGCGRWPTVRHALGTGLV